MLVALLLASSSLLGYYGYYRYKKRRRAKGKLISRTGTRSRVRIFSALKYPNSKTTSANASKDTVGSSSSLRTSLFRGLALSRRQVTSSTASQQSSDIESGAIVPSNKPRRDSEIKVVDSATDLQSLEYIQKQSFTRASCSRTLRGMYYWTQGWTRFTLFKYCTPRKGQRLLPPPETIDETSVLLSDDESTQVEESGARAFIEQQQQHRKSDSFYSMEQGYWQKSGGAHSRKDSAASLEASETSQEKLLDCSQEGVSSVASCGSTCDIEISEERIQFLQAYDQAFIDVLNKIYGCNAKDLNDLPDLPVAPWNKSRPGFKGCLSDEQAECLRQVKERFPDYARFHSEHDMLKFLRSCNFNLDMMIEKYQKYIEEYRGVYLQSPYPAVRDVRGECFENLDQLMSSLPVRHHQLTEYWQNIYKYFLENMIYQCDKQGRPVLYVRMTEQWNRKFSEQVDMEDRLLMASSSIELQRILCHMVSKKMGYIVEELIQIIDLDGLPPRGLLGCLAGGDQSRELHFNFDFNPDAISKIYIVNVPGGPMTRMVWNTVSMAMPKRMRSRISLLGRGYQKTLKQEIGQENIPACYGGGGQFKWATKPDLERWEKYIEEMELQADEKV
eukprot:TRINITY_DN2139_c0_g1_i1.p1 TRINITY_DN2139_c0_g1~~TRINITY_DN2139_c0_g1_i1.p1  ORF type:complete len:615 (+),score=57.80 TRINITY_DN2139_c0_g1_i1:214-2058(+)